MLIYLYSKIQAFAKITCFDIHFLLNSFKPGVAKNAVWNIPSLMLLTLSSRSNVKLFNNTEVQVHVMRQTL